MLFNIKKIRERGLNLRMLWDLFMVLFACVNLLLILFDFTYFYTRPYYREHAPEIVKQYDPIKGVRPHPTTIRYENMAMSYLNDLAEGSDLRATDYESMLRMHDEAMDLGVYRDAGLTDAPLEIQAAMLEKLSAEGRSVEPVDAAREYFAPLESVGGDRIENEDSDVLAARRRHFEREILSILTRNFDRERTPKGTYVDDFIWIDAPFLLVFFIEFLVRWWIAIRRKTYIRWFLFPLYNWYDLLGLIPFAEFRFFRLFRIASIYVRLYRSDLTKVGDDFISRSIKRVSEIIAEEVSDMVAIRILKEMQDELRAGTSADVLIRALEPRRDALKDLILRYAKRMAEEQPGRKRMEEMLAISLEDAAKRVPSLTLVPDSIKVTLTREIGLAVFQAINDALAEQLLTEGEDSVGDIVDFMIDDLIQMGDDSELHLLFRDVSIDTIENMKHAVRVKKWADDSIRHPQSM